MVNHSHFWCICGKRWKHKGACKGRKGDGKRIKDLERGKNMGEEKIVELQYKTPKGRWVTHYRRPESHKDIEQFKELAAKNPLYRIRKCY